MKETKTYHGEDYQIIESMDYKPLIPIFIGAGLEATEFPEIKDALFNCYYLYVEENLIGGAAVLKYGTDFIIQDFAIEKSWQGLGYGTLVYEYMKADIKSHGGKAIYLTGKAPEFYKRFGFVEIDGSKIPGKIPGCFTCHRYNENCFPIFMALDL